MALKLAVLLSGGGTTFENIFTHIDAGNLYAEVVCVVSSRRDAYGITRAQNHNVPVAVVARKEYTDSDAFADAVWAQIRKFDVDLVVLAGFMSLLSIPPDFVNRVVNTHPALIPAFCGKGMYGHHVYEAVLAKGAKITGVTVHFADQEYDHGPIIAQESVPVLEDDTVETLSARVQATEREVYVKAIQLIAEGRVQVNGQRARILPAKP